MSATSVATKMNLKINDIKDRSGYMTTTELSRLCGVSRFTIINWIKQGRIKVIRTVGNHYRISESEAASLLDTIEEKKENPTSISEESGSKQKKKKLNMLKRGICLIRDKKKRRVKPKKNIVLYAFGYGVGRGVHVLKGRSKDK